jgi:uncharacterized membrane protein YfcA
MKIRKPAPLSREHAELGLPPAEASASGETAHPVLNAAAWFTVAVLAALSIYLATRLNAQVVVEALHSGPFWGAVAVGFFAQAVDGALGMAYGVTATTFLLGAGASPAAASASVHIAEIFTTGFSGVAHLKYGNVNRRLFTRLLVPGILGAVLGTVFITQVDGKLIRPYVTAYLLLMGLYILSKAFRRFSARAREPRHVGKLAAFGGFVDAAGGGGWGPVVTSTLVGSGRDPRTTIGSVNFAEFFITVATAASFSLLAGPGIWLLVAGLVVGGLFAAPFAALLCRHLQARALLILVGALITALSAWNLYRTLAA